MSSNIKTAYALADDNLVAFYFHNYVLNSMITFFFWGGGGAGECKVRGTGSVRQI